MRIALVDDTPMELEILSDIISKEMPTAQALPIIIGNVAAFTNSKAYAESLIFVKKIISICITSQIIPIPTP